MFSLRNKTICQSYLHNFSLSGALIFLAGDDLLVKISGLTVTTRFGSGEDISANGREEKLVRYRFIYHIIWL